MERDLKVGDKYGRWTILEKDPESHRLKLFCRCSCGNVRSVYAYNLLSGASQYCGCLNREICSKSITKRNTTHGDYNSPAYTSWVSMWRRCTKPKDSAYRYYGARGIMVCEQWKRYETFLKDMGPRPAGITLHRLSVNGNYEPSNCVWATSFVQGYEKTNTVRYSYRGNLVTTFELSKLTGLTLHAIRRRRYQNWDNERLITQPMRYTKSIS